MYIAFAIRSVEVTKFQHGPCVDIFTAAPLVPVEALGASSPLNLHCPSTISMSIIMPYGHNVPTGGDMTKWKRAWKDMYNNVHIKRGGARPPTPKSIQGVQVVHLVIWQSCLHIYGEVCTANIKSP